MNICFIAIYPIVPYIGGVQRVTDTLAKEFQKRGHLVHFLAYSRRHMLEMGPFSAPQHFIDFETQNLFEVEKELIQFLNKHKIDIIINQNFNNGAFVKLINHKVKIITVCHTQPFPNHYKDCLINTTAHSIKQKLLKGIGIIAPCITSKYSDIRQEKLIRSALVYSDKICFISERFINRVLSHIEVENVNKLVGINNPNTFEPSDNNSPKENIILWVGRIYNGEKNAIGFIKTWERLYKKHPTWKAIMIGSGSDLENNKEYVRSHNIQNFEFTGRINNVSSYYAKAKAVVVTSWSESWCMTLPEGMSYGCIPFAYNTYESLQDIISNGIDGFVVDANEDELVSRLDYFMNSEEVFLRMSPNAIHKISRFSVQNIVNQWEKLIKQTLYE